MPGAEALHLQTGSATGTGPINIASADLRRPSTVSAASMPGLESVGGMFGSVEAQAQTPSGKSFFFFFFFFPSFSGFPICCVCLVLTAWILLGHALR
jgi:hypothetical protein